MQCKFTLMEDSHFPLYESHVRPEMAPVDYINWEYYLKTKKEKTWQAWILHKENDLKDWIGWYAVASPSPSNDHATHVYGFVVFKPYRQGLNRYAFQLGQHLYSKCLGTPITASIRPDNTQALRLAVKAGFLPFDWKTPWVELIKQPT